MAATMTTGLRRGLALALIVALTLAGLGRALAAAADGIAGPDPVPGVHVPICHSGAGEAPADPASPGDHDCCDACALLAPAVLPLPPAVAGPMPSAHVAVLPPAVPRSPAVARPRGPRLPRGPPAA